MTIDSEWIAWNRVTETGKKQKQNKSPSINFDWAEEMNTCKTTMQSNITELI